MDIIILGLLIIMVGVIMAYSKEIYLYLVLTLGSIMADIIDKVNSIIGRKK